VGDEESKQEGEKDRLCSANGLRGMWRTGDTGAKDKRKTIHTGRRGGRGTRREKKDNGFVETPQTYAGVNK